MHFANAVQHTDTQKYPKDDLRRRLGHVGSEEENDGDDEADVAQQVSQQVASENRLVRSLLAERLNLFVVQLVETEQMIIIDFRYANRLVKVVDELLIDASISPVINEHANY